MLFNVHCTVYTCYSTYTIVIQCTPLLFNVHLGYVDVFVPGVKDVSVVTAGQRFMTDLLVSSLMAGGGLETSLDTAFRKETQQVDDTKVSGH